jgi:hypothetical protein
MATSRAAASYGRRRAGTACDVCRARKTKCDNRRPICGFCEITGGECIYSDDLHFDHSRLDRGSLAILQRIGELEVSLTRLLKVRAECSTVRGLAPMDLVSEDSSCETLPHDPGRRTQSPVEPLEQGRMTRVPMTDAPPTSDAIAASMEMAVEGLLNWPILLCADPDEQPALNLISVLSSKKPPARHQSLGDFAVDPETTHALCARFLSTNHVKNPIFDLERFWDDFNNFRATRLQWDGRSCLIVSNPVAEIVHPMVLMLMVIFSFSCAL